MLFVLALCCISFFSLNFSVEKEQRDRETGTALHAYLLDVAVAQAAQRGA